MTQAQKIEGYEELKKAINEHNLYQDKCIAASESEIGCTEIIEKPISSLDELVKRYPLANLYLKAEGYTFASNDKKNAAGHKAMQVLENTGDLKKAAEILKNWIFN